MDFTEALSVGDVERNIIPVRKPVVEDEDRMAMAVLKDQGVTVTELSELFGFSPTTVRRSIAMVQGADLEAVRRVVAAELYALSRLAAKNYLIALLERNPNRLHKDRDGNEIPGAYVVDDASVMKVVEKALSGLQAAAAPAGMDKAEQASGSLLANWAQNEEALNRVMRSLPAGMKLKIHQSVEVGEDDDSSSSSPSSSVSADFSVEE